MTVMACALLWCLGLVESIPVKRGYQHVARDAAGQDQPVSPDFVMQLRVSDNTTATLFAYKRWAPIHPLTAEEQMTLTGGGGGGVGGGVGGGREWKEDNRSLVDTEIELSLLSQQLKHHSSQSSTYSSDVYDEKGAMYFAVAVILFYGISIAMLVAASTLKESHTDYELKGFLRSYARIDEERRSREKQKIRMVLQQKNLMHMLPGCNLAGNTALLTGTVDRQQQQQLQPRNPTQPHPLQQQNTTREQHSLQQHPLQQHPLQQYPLQQHPLQEPTSTREQHPLQQQITTRGQHPLEQQVTTREQHLLQQQPLQQHPLQQHPLQQHPLQQPPMQQHPLQKRSLRNTQKRPETQKTNKRRCEGEEQHTYHENPKFQQQNPKRQQRQQVHAVRHSVKVLFREKDGSTRTEAEVDPSPEVDGNIRKKTTRRKSTNDLLRVSSVVMDTAAVAAPAPSPAPLIIPADQMT